MQTFDLPFSQDRERFLLLLLPILIGLALGLGMNLFSVRLSIIAMGIICAVLIVFLNPFIGLLAMAAMIPMEELTTLGQSFTAIRLLGVVVLAAWLLQVLIRKERINTNDVFWIAIIMACWFLTTSLWAEDRTLSFTRMLVLIQLIGLYLVTINLVKSKSHFNFVLWLYIFGSTAASILAALNIQSSLLLRASVVEGQNPNIFAKATGLGLIASMFLFTKTSSKIQRSLLTICSIIMVAGIILSQSRGAWVALLVVLLLQIAVSRKKRLRMLFVTSFLVFVTILAGLGLNLVKEDIAERASSVVTLADRGSYRLDIWLVGWNLVKDNFLFGVGLNNFLNTYSRYRNHTIGVKDDLKYARDPHNIFLSVQGETGILGLALFSTVLLLTLQNIRSNKTNTSIKLCLPLLIFTVIAGLTSTIHFKKFFWLALAISYLGSSLTMEDED